MPFNQFRNGSSARSFEEARKSNIWFKCSAPLNSGYSCKTGSVIQNAFKRLNNAESHVQIVPDIFNEYEDENDSAQPINIVQCDGGSAYR